MKRFTYRLPYLLCFLVAFVLAMKQLREPDIWWQLLSGRWMLEHGAITRTDVFSYTMAGHRWINVKWLYEIFIAIIEKGFGPEGVLLLQGLVNIVIVYFLLRILKNFSARLNTQITTFYTVIPLLLFLAIVEYRMAGRPEMISHLMCVVFLFFIIRYPQLQWKQVFWLIPLQCLWANMHEGYPVGLVMIGTLAAGNLLHYVITKEKKDLQPFIRALILFAAAAIIVLLNPNGIQLWKQPFEIYRQVWANKYTTELYSISQAEYWTVEAKCHVVLLISIIIFWFIQLRINWTKKDSMLRSPAVISYLLLIPLFGYLSITANRNIIFSEIILFPSVPLMIVAIVKAIKANTWNIYLELQKGAVLITCVIVLVFYTLVVSNIFYKYSDSPNRYGLHINMLHNPTGAADFIKQHHITGVGFSDYFVSSYLLWDMYPDFRSYIDLRDLDVFPTSFFESYFEMYAQPNKFYEEDKKYNFNYVVISTSQLIGLQQKLYNEKGFYQVYIDPVATVFVRENEANRYIYDNKDIVKQFSWPAPVEDPAWATLLTKALNPMVSYDEEDEMHANARAIAYYNAIGAYDVAISLSRRSHNDPEVLKALADTYMRISKMVTDPRQKQAYQDSAVNLAEIAKNIEH